MVDLSFGSIGVYFACRLVLKRMPHMGAQTLEHAKAYRDIIRQFGRFHYRNDALQRSETEAEREYLANGRYYLTIEKLLKAT